MSSRVRDTATTRQGVRARVSTTQKLMRTELHRAAEAHGHQITELPVVPSSKRKCGAHNLITVPTTTDRRGTVVRVQAHQAQMQRRNGGQNDNPREELPGTVKPRAGEAARRKQSVTTRSRNPLSTGRSLIPHNGTILDVIVPGTIIFGQGSAPSA